MPASYGPPWGSRRASQANPDMRVSNAERAEVADRLSKHYGDGRLDEEEFNERLDRAMKAKTQSDLRALFADLPDLPDLPGSSKEVKPMPQQRSLFPRILLFVLLIIAASALWHALTPPFLGLALGGLYVPWLIIAVIAFLVWRSGAWHRRP
jgi:Domain of unknown function (DUF1707)